MPLPDAVTLALQILDLVLWAVYYGLSIDARNRLLVLKVDYMYEVGNRSELGDRQEVDSNSRRPLFAHRPLTGNLGVGCLASFAQVGHLVHGTSHKISISPSFYRWRVAAWSLGPLCGTNMTNNAKDSLLTVESSAVGGQKPFIGCKIASSATIILNK